MEAKEIIKNIVKAWNQPHYGNYDALIDHLVDPILEAEMWLKEQND